MTTPQGAGSPPEADHGVDHLGDTDDDAALGWGDEHDTTHVDAPDNAVRVARVRRERDPDAPTGSGALVGMGVIGAVYLLYTVAWLISASTEYVSGVDTLLTLAVEVFRVLAIVAPAAWFTVTLWAGARAGARTRFLWLLLGLVVLVPWPFVMTRSFG